jgi:hypothetical protein
LTGNLQHSASNETPFAGSASGTISLVASP